MMSRQTTVLLLAGIGESDCEAIAGGLLAQPVNALSSLAYVVAGLALVGRATRNRAARALTQTIFGLAMVGVGLGSIAFHGPMPPGARLVHDLANAAVFAVVLAAGVGCLRRWSEATVIAGFVGIVAVLGAVMAFSPDAGPALLGLVAAAAIGIECFILRTGKRSPHSPRVIRRLAAVLALFIIAGLVQLLGRTGAPLCDPDSVYQGHAVWHVLTATAFGLYGLVVFPGRVPESAAPSASRAPQGT